MRRVLIPVQRLDLARPPIWQVRRLLHDPQAEVVLLGVVPAGASQASRQALSDGLDALAGEILAAGVRAHSSLVEGELAERVGDMVRLSQADLVALATPAPPGPGGWALTREAIHLLFTCPVPLMVLAGETAPRTVRRILVPLDGSPRASSILGLVTTFARAHQAEVTLLRVARCRGALPTALPTALVAELEETLEPALARLTAEGVSARLQVESDPSEVEGILRVAREQEADLLALTTRGEGGGGEWPFGSIAEGLVRRARLPLLVQRVPEPPAEPEPAPPRTRVSLSAPPPREAPTAAGTILVPTDGGALGDVALAVLPRLVPSCAAGARLLQVLPEPSGEGVEAHRAEVESAGRHLDGLVERLARIGVPAQTRVVRGDPSGRILAAARDADVGLVVMTSHARTGVGRWLLGSVAERVLRRADAPVLVLSPAALGGLDPRGPRFARILVADDGSPTAAAALDPVLALARAHESEVTLCGVAPDSQVAHGLLERLRPHRERLAAGGVQARVEVIVGAEPVTELLRASAGVDLVAMGTHGREGLFRAWLGSITEEVLRRIERPLLVVRAPSPTHPT